MVTADNRREAHPQQHQLDVLTLLQELGVIANGSLSVGNALYQSLAAIGRHTGWRRGRVKLEEQAIDLVNEPAITWSSREAGEWPALPEGLPANGATTLVTLEDAAGEGEPPLRGYIACPIYAADQRVGLLEFLAEEPLQVGPELRQVLSHAATLMGLVIGRGHTQAGLRENERRFRAIFDQSYQFIGLMEPDGTLIEANQTALQFGGLTLSDVVGKPFWEAYWWRVSPETQAQLKDAIRRAAKGELIHYDVEVQGEGGQIITIDFSIKPIHDLAGNVVLLIPEGRDITALRQTLESLRRAEARLEEAQRVARMGHWDYDVANEQGFWSDTLFEVFGVPQEGVASPGEAFMARVHPDDVDRVRRQVDRAYRIRQNYEITYRIRHADDSIRTVRAAGYFRTDEAGEVSRMTGIVQDITRSRELEESLARSLERLSLVNGVGQVVAATFDLEQIYRQVLDAARNMLGAELVVLFEYDHEQLHIRAASHNGNLTIQPWSIPPGVGVVGEVWTSGRAVWLSGEECRRRRSDMLMRLTGFEPQSMLTVPVRWQDQVVGVLQAVNSQEDAFVDGDLDSLQALGTWTAIAIGKARQHASLERRLNESQAIAEISRALAETLEPERILDLIAINAQEIAPRTDWTVIHLLRGRPERLLPAAAAGDAPPADEYVIAPGKGLAWQALDSGQLINVPDVDADGRVSGFARGAGVRSMLIAPIQSRNRSIGTITSVSRTLNTFTAEDERLLTILASQAAMAIENTQLYDAQRRARAVAELQRERLRELTQRLVTAQEDERLRISRELHDEAGQALTSLKISLDLLRSGLPPEQESLRARLADVAGLADGTMEMLRTLAHDLRPPGLDTFGLNVALEGLCYDFSARTQLPIAYHGVELPELSTAEALSIYRLVQEALTNSAKHAEATQVTVRLARDDGALAVEIEDNGKGFASNGDSPRQRGGIGLVSMRERAELLGGTLDIETAPGSGTKLTAHIPLERIKGSKAS